LKLFFYITIFSLLFISCTNVISDENTKNEILEKNPNPNSQMHNLLNLSEYSESQKKLKLQSASNKASKRILNLELNLTEKYGTLDKEKIIRNSPYTLIYLYADW
jgi:hypothetical protein